MLLINDKPSLKVIIYVINQNIYCFYGTAMVFRKENYH